MSKKRYYKAIREELNKNPNEEAYRIIEKLWKHSRPLSLDIAVYNILKVKNLDGATGAEIYNELHFVNKKVHEKSVFRSLSDLQYAGFVEGVQEGEMKRYFIKFIF